MDQAFQYSEEITTGAPQYYAFNGVDENGDSQVDLYPVPDKEYTLRINVVLPQEDLELSTDVPLVPAQLIIEGTVARAISERGEDGGMQDQQIRYNQLLSDYIAIEAGQKPNETIWQAV